MLRITISSAAAIAMLLFASKFAIANEYNAVDLRDKSSSVNNVLWAAGKSPIESFTNFSIRSVVSLRTKAFIGSDGYALYVLFRCEQPARSLRESTSVNDLLAQTIDYVEVDLDPSTDGARVYRFLATPNGLRTAYSSESARFNPAWSTFGEVQDRGYTVQVRIPFVAVRGASADRPWGVNLVRHITSTSDLYTWADNASMIDPTADSRFWNHVVGISPLKAKGISPSADVFTLASTGADRNKFSLPGIGLQKQGLRNLGADIRAQLTSGLTFIGTLNPDFSNIEADQVTIAPQEFAQRFRETRPFFAEGASFVAPLFFYGVGATDIRQFYTPALGLVDRGEKIEGSIGNNRVGILETKGDAFEDLAFGYELSKPDQSLQLAVQGTQANHEQGASSTRGISLFSQNPRSGVYGNLQVISASGLGTSAGSSSAAVVASGVHNATINAGGGYESVGPSFGAFDAYVANNDIRGPFVNADLQLHDDRLGLKTIEFAASADRLTNWIGKPAESDSYLGLNILTKNLVAISVSSAISSLAIYSAGYPTYSGVTNDVFNSTSISFTLGTGATTSGGATYSFGPFAQYCGSSVICSGGSGYVPAYSHQSELFFSAPFSRRYSIRLDYDGSLLRNTASSTTDSQWLRKVTIARSIGSLGTVNLQLREITGYGGNAAPGLNPSIGYNQRFRNLNQLYFEYGSPASSRTLNRAVLKFVLHVGQSPGT